MANEKIRRAARESGVRLWQLADAWGVNDVTFCKKLRHQFRPEDERRALEIIDELRKEAGSNAANAYDNRGREGDQGN